MEPTPQQIRQNAVPLSKAWFEFATENIRLDYNNLVKPPEGPNFDAAPSFQSLAKLMLAPQAESQRQRQLAQVTESMRDDLRCWLVDKELLAYGHQAQPVQVRQFRRIPADFWPSAIIHWDIDRAKDAERVYQRIRILAPEDFPETEFERRVGRKSYDRVIVPIAEQLEKERPDFWTISHKARNGLIRALIIERHEDIDPYGPNLGDDAIRKMLKRRFQKP